MKSLSVYEYGYVSTENSTNTAINQVPKDVFSYLESLCLKQSEKSVFLRLKSINGIKAIQFLNYAGVVITPTGFQIEILPKVAKQNDDKNKSRKSLLMMLKTLGEFRHISTNSADIANTNMPLLELFITDFLQSLNKLVKQGLHRDYIPKEENINTFKGKLLIRKQFQHNAVNKHKFFVEFDEYQHNRPINRVIATALKKVNSYCKSQINQKLAQELSYAFVDIPLCKDFKQDLKKIKFTRGMTNYQTPLNWAKIILNGFSPITLKGSNSALSLLFPMEAIFESYAAFILKKSIQTNITLQSQISSTSLVNHQEKGYFRLKPDLVLRDGAKNVCVLDSKWKLVDQNKANGSDKYGLSQADFYQMFAYGHKYLNGRGEMFLIYPKYENFSQPIESCFDFSDDSNNKGQLKLFVMPLCLDEGTQDNKRLIWPKEANTQKVINHESYL